MRRAVVREFFFEDRTGGSLSHAVGAEKCLDLFRRNVYLHMGAEGFQVGPGENRAPFCVLRMFQEDFPRARGEVAEMNKIVQGKIKYISRNAGNHQHPNQSHCV